MNVKKVIGGVAATTAAIGVGVGYGTGIAALARRHRMEKASSPNCQYVDKIDKGCVGKEMIPTPLGVMCPDKANVNYRAAHRKCEDYSDGWQTGAILGGLFSGLAVLGVVPALAAHGASLIAEGAEEPNPKPAKAEKNSTARDEETGLGKAT